MKGCLLSILAGWKVLLVLEISLLVIVTLAGWALHFKSVSDFANLMILGAIALVGIGAFSMMGGYNSTRSAGYLIASSAGADDMSKSARRGNDYNLGAFACFLQSVIVAVLTVALSLLVLALFG